MPASSDRCTDLFYRVKTILRPSSTAAMSFGDTEPICSVRKDLLSVITCDTFTTESRDNPDCFRLINRFPGAADNFKFEVTTTTTTVWILLSVNELDCTMRTGRRYPGSDAFGADIDAHQSSPRCTTTPRRAEPSPEVRGQPDPFRLVPFGKHH